MRNIYLIAGAALLLFAALVAWEGGGTGPRIAQPQPAAEGQETDPNRPATVPGIPGITGPDQAPNGCVDCHRQVDASRDFRLSTTIQQMAQEGRHPDTSEEARTEEIPDSCMRCHGAESPLALGNIMHASHYQGDDNTFITRYEGQCLHCHSLDRDEGVIDIKSGREKDSA